MITKSDFKTGMECPKHLWLIKHRPDMIKKEEMSLLQTEGIEVGKLASNLFENVTAIPDTYITERQVDKTKELIKEGGIVISEAAFVADGLLCKVDYLEVVGDEIIINEVKAKTRIRTKGGALEKEFLYDCAFQYYVLTRAGYAVKQVNCIHLNGEYVRHGDLDYENLFESEDITCEVLEYFSSTENSIAEDINALKIYLGKSEEPGDEICFDCRECEMADHCWKNIPSPNVWDLNGRYTKTTRKNELYRQGLVAFEDLLNHGSIADKAKMQIEAELNNEKYINREEIKKFIDKIRFPLYFLDFETFSMAVPEFEGQWPYEKVPFQYSLHVLHEPGGKLEHFEYLADEIIDPRREIAESLIKRVPADACVAAYYKSFECDRLKELAEMFPDLEEHLLSIERNIVDFIKPFDNYHYMVRGMQGKSSIKKVPLALFPDDESLDYSKLPGVKRGDQASEMFIKLRDMDPEEREKTREGMLLYCEKDTYCMVRIYDALVEAIEWE